MVWRCKSVSGCGCGCGLGVRKLIWDFTPWSLYPEKGYGTLLLLAMRLPLECVVAATIVLFLRIPLVAALQLQIPFFGPALQEQQHLQLKSIYYRTPESVVFRNAVGTESTDDPLTLKPVWQRIYRPRDTDKLLQMHEQGSLMRWPLLVNNGSFAAPSAGGTNIPGTYAWELVPDVTHRPSILSLAIMTNNAYTHVDKNDTSDWYPLDPSWNVVCVSSQKATIM